MLKLKYIKKTLFLLSAFYLSLVSVTAQPKQKLITIEDDYTFALDKAKQKNHLLFSIVYSMSCGMSKLEEALTSDTIGDFLNKNYIVLMIRADNENNRYFKEKYNIKANGFYIINPQTENIWYKYTYEMNKNSLSRTAKRALDSNNSHSYLLEKYDTLVDKVFLLNFLKTIYRTDEFNIEYHY